MLLFGPLVIDEETKVKRSKETCLRSHNWQVVELGFKTGFCAGNLYILLSFRAGMYLGKKKCLAAL